MIEPRLLIVSNIRHAGFAITVFLAIVSVTAGLAPVGFVIGISNVIGRIPTADFPSLAAAVIATFAMFFAQQLLTPLLASVGTVLKHRVDGYVHGRVIEASLRTAGIGPLEDQESLAGLREAVESLRTGWRTPGDACVAIFALVVRYVRLIGFLVVIGLAISWLAATAIGASTLLFRYGHRSGLRIRMRVWPRMMGLRRESAYFRDTGLGVGAAKEIRVFGIAPWLIERYRTSHLAFLGPMWRERRRVNVNRFLWFSTVGLAVVAAVFVIILRSAAQGEVTLTELSLGLQAAIGAILLGEFYHEADDATQYGMEAVRALAGFERRVEGFTAKDALAVADGGAATGLPRSEIRLEGVSFTYPGASRPTLDGLGLTLRAGECTALVGLNGAGKTTLVKLLTRLYDADEGTIFVDGRDVRDLSVDLWRRQLAVIFQNFNRYEMSAADNVVFGAIEHRADDAVRAAVEAAGIATVFDALPYGLSSPLSPSLDGGTDLSGGQWQRVAIARALYAIDAGARLLILDEPTAALDVRAEAQFLNEFFPLTRGVMSLLISHRFSSVRRADRIVVLDGGQIVEDGTHDSLLAGNGRYAELFNLQAARFAADDEDVR